MKINSFNQNMKKLSGYLNQSKNEIRATNFYNLSKIIKYNIEINNCRKYVASRFPYFISNKHIYLQSPVTADETNSLYIGNSSSQKEKKKAPTK